MHLEVRRKGEQPIVERFETLPRRAFELVLLLWWGDGRLVRGHVPPVRLPANAFANALELVEASFEEGFGIATPHDPPTDEVAGELLADGELVLDRGVHARLGQRWIVAFVVSPASVAEQIDQKVLAELRAVGRGEPDRGEAGDGIVGVD